MNDRQLLQRDMTRNALKSVFHRNCNCHQIAKTVAVANAKNTGWAEPFTIDVREWDEPMDRNLGRGDCFAND